MMGGAWFAKLFGDPDTCPTSRFEESALRGVAEQLKVTVEPSKVLVKVQKVT